MRVAGYRECVTRTVTAPQPLVKMRNCTQLKSVLKVETLEGRSLIVGRAVGGALRESGSRCELASITVYVHNKPLLNFHPRHYNNDHISSDTSARLDTLTHPTPTTCAASNSDLAKHTPPARQAHRVCTSPHPLHSTSLNAATHRIREQSWTQRYASFSLPLLLFSRDVICSGGGSPAVKCEAQHHVQSVVPHGSAQTRLQRTTGTHLPAARARWHKDTVDSHHERLTTAAVMRHNTTRHSQQLNPNPHPPHPPLPHLPPLTMTLIAPLSLFAPAPFASTTRTWFRRLPAAPSRLFTSAPSRSLPFPPSTKPTRSRPRTRRCSATQTQISRSHNPPRTTRLLTRRS
jgi:hypothetical protein